MHYTLLAYSFILTCIKIKERSPLAFVSALLLYGLFRGWVGPFPRLLGPPSRCSSLGPLLAKVSAFSRGRLPLLGWHPCRLGVPLASISRPRPRAAALVYSATMVGSLSLTRWGFQRSPCVRFWCRGAPPALCLGVSPLTVFIIAPVALFVKRFFIFLWDFFSRPTNRPASPQSGFLPISVPVPHTSH